jgi:hypothetical protein
MGPENWSLEWAADTSGAAEARQLNLYKQSRRKRDYLVDFTGVIEERALGIVFRVQDTRNYYCWKLKVSGDGVYRKAALVRFAVVNGEEQSLTQVALSEPVLKGQLVKMQIDVRGDRFTAHWNGKPVDVWTDSRMQEGSLGFSNERGERAMIRSVKVIY